MAALPFLQTDKQGVPNTSHTDHGVTLPHAAGWCGGVGLLLHGHAAMPDLV